MEKIRVKSENTYEIEVNDEGETIVFNLDDIELPLKLEKTVEELSKIQQRIKAQQQIIKNKQDEHGKYMLTKNELELAKLLKEAYSEQRKALDNFLGAGACQKIFGDINYMTMFDDLFKALDPHFEKMGIKQNAFNKAIAKKYKREDNEELS